MPSFDQSRKDFAPYGFTCELWTPDPALSRADQIACYIARHYDEPLTADQIAKAVGLHPKSGKRRRSGIRSVKKQL